MDPSRVYPEVILNLGIEARICQLVIQGSDLIQEPALRLVSELLSGTEQHVDQLIQAGVITSLSI